jgi:hypothetical protein
MGGNIIMDVKNGCERVQWGQIMQGLVPWEAFVKTVMNIQVA